MRCATQTGPDQADLRRVRGLNRDHFTESGKTIYGLGSLIRTPSRVCTVWSGHYLGSIQSYESPSQSLVRFIIAWSSAWRVLWYDLDSLKRGLSRVCRSDQKLFQSLESLIRTKKSNPKRPVPWKEEEIVNPRGDCFWSAPPNVTWWTSNTTMKTKFWLLLLSWKIRSL